MARRNLTRVRSKLGTIEVSLDDGDIVRALNRGAEGMRTAASEAMIDAGSVLVAEMRDRIQKYGKVHRGMSGGLLGSIGAEVTGRRGQQTVTVGPDAEHEVQAATIARGRRPGSAMPPSGVLLPWMRDHGIPEEAEFPLRRAIGQRGLQNQPWPFPVDTVRAKKPEIDRLFDAVADKAIEAIRRG